MSKKSRFWGWKGFLAIILVMLLIPACSPSTEDSPATKPVIRLIVNPWQASELNAMVAKILLEEQMGYTVEFVPFDEEAQWEALASGQAHAALEVWESGRAADIQYYINETHLVQDGGYLGPVGKIGWYMPAYMLTEHPELIQWESFGDPELAGLFATEATGEKGQLLVGDPTWVQFDDQIIQNLGLDLQTVRVGSEDAILAELESAYSQNQPLLFYLWDPHWALGSYNLVQVNLPPYSPECYARAAAGGVDCDYPAERLLKVFWPGLQEYAPEAYAFLQNFYYTNSDQIEMLTDVHNGMTTEQAARNWIQNHISLANSWIP